MRLTLPWKDRVTVTWKHIGLILFGGLILIGCVACAATGQLRTATRMFNSWAQRYHDGKIKKLDLKVVSNWDRLNKEKGAREKVKAERRDLIKRRTTALLRVEGMSHDEVIAELTRRGF